MLTFLKLLASILLVERFVDDRTSEIINHELEDGLYFRFGVSSIVRDSLILGTVSKYRRVIVRYSNSPIHPGRI